MDDSSVPPTKRCRKCGEEKPTTTEHFERHKLCKYGLHSQCKACRYPVKTAQARARGVKARPPLVERFWSKVIRGGENECWPFTGPVRGDRGHRGFTIGLRDYYAHRVAYALATGGDPRRLGDPQVLHHCDNPPCCNPRHLFLGTNADNVADKVAKGRQSRGEAHSIAIKRAAAARKAG